MATFRVRCRIGQISDKNEARSLSRFRQIRLRDSRPVVGFAPGVVGDIVRTRSGLAAEDALLRQQLIIASRKVKRPVLKPGERGLLMLLSRWVPQWGSALLLVKLETVQRSLGSVRVLGRTGTGTVSILVATDLLLWRRRRARLSNGIEADDRCPLCLRTLQD